MIRVGTRDSQLALWQAETVSRQLAANHHSTQLVHIKSEGDLNLTTPLYEMGVQGIFTRALDVALLNNEIDLAVHSFKDIPIQPAKGLKVAAILERANPYDVLVCRDAESLMRYRDGLESESGGGEIATSSIRRRAQWLHRFPQQAMVSLRGNVNTRLQKLKDAKWDGAIFAAAGLLRLGLTEKETGPQWLLSWMLPAPAQGAMAIVCRENDEEMMAAAAPLHHHHTAICTTVERDFLRIMMGGCSTPYAALAEITKDIVHLKANITSTDGKDQIEIAVQDNITNYATLAANAVAAIKKQDVHQLLKY